MYLLHFSLFLSVGHCYAFGNWVECWMMAKLSAFSCLVFFKRRCHSSLPLLILCSAWGFCSLGQLCHSPVAQWFAVLWCGQRAQADQVLTRLNSLGMQASFSPSRTFCLHEMKATSNFFLVHGAVVDECVCVYACTSDKLHLADKIQGKLNQQLLNMSS